MHELSELLRNANNLPLGAGLTAERFQCRLLLDCTDCGTEAICIFKFDRMPQVLKSL